MGEKGKGNWERLESKEYNDPLGQTHSSETLFSLCFDQLDFERWGRTDGRTDDICAKTMIPTGRHVTVGWPSGSKEKLGEEICINSSEHLCCKMYVCTYYSIQSRVANKIRTMQIISSLEKLLSFIPKSNYNMATLNEKK